MTKIHSQISFYFNLFIHYNHIQHFLYYNKMILLPCLSHKSKNLYIKTAK